MNINRNNYEEFFLLYADNELSPAEKYAVDDFVKANPDLEEELLMFRNATLVPDNIVFENKESLFRKEDQFITEGNCESIFVLYHDHELSLEERDLTEKFLASHPQQQKSFDDIQNSRLLPEEIIFPDKKKLYRKEDGGKVVPFRLWRAAAAVLLLAFSIYGGFRYLKAKKANDTAITKPAILQENKVLPKLPEPAENLIQQPVSQDVANTPAESKMKRVNVVLPQKQPVTQKDTRPQDKLIVLDDKEKKENSNQLPLPVIIQDQIKKDNDVVVKDKLSNNLPVPDEQQPPKPDKANVIAVKNDINTNDVANASHASFKEDDYSNKDNYVFYNIPEEKFKKSKVGIFLRKVKRVVTRNTFLGGKGRIANVDTDAK